MLNNFNNIIAQMAFDDLLRNYPDCQKTYRLEEIRVEEYNHLDALGLSSGESNSCFAQSRPQNTLDDFRLCIDGKSTGAVRISLGATSNSDDAYSFVQFTRGFIDTQALTWAIH
jgi:hypothetical protein